MFAGYAGAFGNAILVRNGDVVWNLAHHKNLNGRARGQRVTVNEYLAPQGATGLAFGVHTHCERRTGGGDTIQSGAHSDPERYFTSLSGGASKPFEPPVPVKKKLKESDMPFPIKSGSGALALLGEFSAQILEWPRDAELWAAAKFIHEMDADPAPLADEHWRLLVGAANGRRAELVKEVSGRPGEFPAEFVADVKDAARVGAKEGTGEAINGATATIRAAAT
nr:hypothetical protein [Microbacterium sp. BR1]